jgi:hypothetical protein
MGGVWLEGGVWEAYVWPLTAVRRPASDTAKASSKRQHSKLSTRA